MSPRTLLACLLRLTGPLLLAAAAVLLWARPSHAQDIWHVDDSTPDGLVAHWKFDEPGTSTARAYVGGVNGTLQFTATMGFGPLPPVNFTDAGVLNLDGVADATPARVAMASNGALNLVTQFTVAGWVKRNDADIGTGSTIYDAGSNSGTWFVGLLSNNRLAFTTDGFTDFASSHVIADTDWHHVAFTKNNGTVFVYLDGVPAVGLSVPLTIPVPSGGILVGSKSSANTAPFGGLIDDLRLYNRALSVVEVQRLAQEGKGCVSTGVDWDTAFRDLHCALAAADAGDDIWIGAGTYTPSTNPFVPYALKPGVDLFGNFTGTAGAKETLLSQRPAFIPTAPLTTLSGDIADNDNPLTFANYTDNSNVILSAATGAGVVDGLRVQGGNARAGFLNFGSTGSGLRVLAGGTVTLRDVTFFANQSDERGGAVVSLAPLIVERARFERNRTLTAGTSLVGGALFISNTAQISDSTFLTNTAQQFGGAIATTAPLRVANSNFTNNRAIVFDGGAIRAEAPLTVTASTFVSNSAGFVGGALSINNFNQPAALIQFSNFTRNRAFTFYGGAIGADGALRVEGGLFVSNTASSSGGAIAGLGSLVIQNGTYRFNRTLGINCVPGPCSQGNGGAIFAQGALTVTSASITTNTAKLQGGGLFAGGPLRVTGSTIADNLAGVPADAGSAGLGRGGGLFAAGSLFLDSTGIENNQANTIGGGAFVSGTVEIRAAAVTGNFAPSGGGLALVGGGVIASSSAAIEDNLYTVAGGGIHFNGPFGATLTIGARPIQRNGPTVVGSSQGGGVHVADGTLVLSGTQVISNVANQGGGVFTTAFATLRPGTQLIGNTAASGGGLFATQQLDNTVQAQAPVQIDGALFQNNKATVSGGGVAAAAPIEVKSTQFVRNQAGNDGGGIRASAPVTITSSLFLSNTAARDGGGLTFRLPTLAGAADAASAAGDLDEFAAAAALAPAGLLQQGATLQGNTFTGNSAGRFGGGARITGASAGDTFTNNRSGSEGGGLAGFDSLQVDRARFLDNLALISGALLFDGPNVQPPTAVLTITNSLFAGNGFSPTNSAGVNDLRLFDAAITLRHNTHAGPNPASASQPAVVIFRGNTLARNLIFADYGISISPDVSSTVDSDFNLFFNAPVSFNVITGTHSLSADPLFANSAAGDYHLTVASPARNAGANVGVTVDFDGQPRPTGPGFDIGFDEALFVNPTAAAGGPYQGSEGTPLPLNGAASTDADNAIATFAWDCTNDGSFEQTLPTPTGASCTYPDQGAFTLRLRVTDQTALTATTTAPVTIANVTPALSGQSNQSAQVGVARAFAIGAFSDPGADAPWSVTINWGDGSPNTVLTLNAAGAIAAQSHLYAAVGQRTVTVQVRDKDDAVGSAAFTVNVTTTPPPPGDISVFLPLVDQ